jgi:hypothetical protein
MIAWLQAKNTVNNNEKQAQDCDIISTWKRK